MKVECNELIQSLKSADPEARAALESHAAGCPDCGAFLQLWNEISVAAPSLRKSWESPDLWPRIRRALAAEAQSERSHRPASRFPALTDSWRAVAATLALVVFSATTMWLLLQRPHETGTQEEPSALRGNGKRLLTEQALSEIESAERAYIQSIDRLSTLAEAKIHAATSPLMVSYREKLMIIDAAIEDCRANIERNRFNAHLRRELLSIYQEKQRTLEQVMSEGMYERN